MLPHIIVAVITAASPAQATPAVSCIYDALGPTERKVMIDARSLNATPEQKTAASAATDAAKRKCGFAAWSLQRQQLAGTYAMARMMLDNVAVVHSDKALRPEMFHRVVAGLPDPVRFKIAQKAVDDALHAELLVKLHGQGMPDDQSVNGIAEIGLRHAVMMAETERAWAATP